MAVLTHASALPAPDSNICPFDARRVVLHRPPEAAQQGSDYMNASHVSPPHLRAIASQGPTHPRWHGPDTTGDFWSAVWEQGVETIVALAKVQPGFSGSSRYWPEAVGETEPACGWAALSVTLLSEVDGSHFTLRRLQLSLSDDAGRDTRAVTHLHYDRWPNYGVPDSPDDVAALLLTVESIEKKRLGQLQAGAAADGAEAPAAPPLWVHCSGGVGRSGVFLTALSTYRSVFPTVAEGLAETPQPFASPEALADAVASTVASLRGQRHPWMVEGREQYAFTHSVIIQACTVTAENGGSPSSDL